MDKESNEKIKKISVVMDKVGSVLKGLGKEMFEGDADQRRVYDTTLDRFRSVDEAVINKMELLTAFAEADNESSDDLVGVLKTVKASIDGATSMDDLLEAKDGLRYVNENLKNVDEELKSKYDAVTEALYVRMYEKRVRIGEDEKH